MKSYNGFSPEIRNRSLTWLKREMVEGRVEPPKCCEACGQTEGILDYHAEDYSEPFGPHIYAHPLCFMCHMVLHRRFQAPEEFKQYRELILNGGRYTPSSSRNIYGISYRIRRGDYGTFEFENRTSHGIYDREDLISDENK